MCGPGVRQLPISPTHGLLNSRVSSLEKENSELQEKIKNLEKKVSEQQSHKTTPSGFKIDKRLKCCIDDDGSKYCPTCYGKIGNIILLQEGGNDGWFCPECSTYIRNPDYRDPDVSVPDFGGDGY